MKTTTLHTVFIKGTPISVPNVVDATPKGYYVSYNNRDTDTYGSDTTAFVIDHSGAFLILNGDHTTATKGFSLEQVCEYFHNHQSLKNKLSDQHEDSHFTIIGNKAVMVRERKIISKT